MSVVKGKRFCLLVIILACTAALSGCAGEDVSGKSASREFFAMDTIMTVTAYGEQCEEAAEEAKAEVERLDALLSTGDADSEVSKINRQGGCDVSEETAFLIEKALEIHKETDGAFDISIYPVMRAWGFTDTNYHVPEEEELRELLKKVDASQIHLEDERKRVSFGMDGMEIDLGGIAKGYTSSRIMEIFRSNGIESGIVSLGGNVQVLGRKTDGENWRVAVQNPKSDEEYLGVLSVSDKAVITSGGYERYFEQDGTTYHHILDPSDGHPAEGGLASVTIVSEDGTLADALSTSLFVMGKEKAFSFWKEHREEFDAIFLDEEGNIWITEGLKEAFTSNFESQVLERQKEE